ncbi:MAG: Na+/H+ antiporter subunit E [Nocardioidaceae bacterium]
MTKPKAWTRGVWIPSRVARLVGWCFLTWVLLTWTATVEVLITGIVLSVAVAVTLAPVGRVVRPWRLSQPTIFVQAVILAGTSLWQIVRANASLSRRIWSPHLPSRTGMVIVPTHERGDGGLAAIGLITSLVVDNQIVDVDRARHELQYHCIDVPEGGRRAAYEAINGPLERRVAKVEGRPDA